MYRPKKEGPELDGGPSASVHFVWTYTQPNEAKNFSKLIPLFSDLLLTSIIMGLGGLHQQLLHLERYIIFLLIRVCNGLKRFSVSPDWSFGKELKNIIRKKNTGNYPVGLSHFYNKKITEGFPKSEYSRQR